MSEKWCQDGKCATRTEARVAWNVVLYCSNRASICSHALILLSPSRWIVMTGWRTSISLHPFVQTRGFLLKTRISLHLVFQTRLDCDSLFVNKHQSHVWSNTFRLWFPVCAHTSDSSPLSKLVWFVHAPVNSPLFQTRLFVVACFVPSRPHQSESLRFLGIVSTKFASSNLLHARTRSLNSRL